MKLNSFSASFKLTLRGKWLLKGITVLLSAFSFTLFSIASMAFTYNEDDHLLRAYRYFLENTYPYVNFSVMLQDREWTSGEAARIQKTTELPHAYLYDKMITSSEFSEYAYILPSDTATPEKAEIYNNLNKTNHLAIVGSEEVYEGFGFRPVAGRYPENVHELAISEEQFAVYRYYGFRDLADHFEWLGTYWNPNIPAAPMEKIKEYSDILGKKVVLFGDLETGDEDSYRAIYEAEIVGIIQSKGRTGDRLSRPYPDGSLFLSREWEEIFHSGHEGCACMISPERPDDAHLRKCITLTKDFVNEYLRQNPEAISRVPAIGLVEMDRLLEIKDIRSPNYFFSGSKSAQALVWGVEGAFFCVFAIILTSHLITALMNMKRKQIGILRALGASRRRVSGYFLIGTLMLSGIIFLVALAMSLAINYGYIVPIMTNEWFGVPKFVYSGWTVLILAGICFTVPVLSALLPLKLYMRRSCVEMMKDTKQKKRGERRRKNGAK